MIIDTHCHLNDEELYKDYKNVIKRAKEAGVEAFFVVGWDYESSKLAVELAENNDCVFAIVGYHPCNIDGVSDTEFEQTMSLLNHPKVVALGEIGLDYYWVEDKEKREEQKRFFVRQIKEANKYKKPISIHCRDATDDCLKILQENHVDRGGVMHCYSGSVESMNEFLKCGMYISLGGPATFKNAKTPKEVAKQVPFDKLLVETDSPYLSPHPLRGTLNEPKNVALVVNEIATLRNISVEEVIEQTKRNTSKLFFNK